MAIDKGDNAKHIKIKKIELSLHLSVILFLDGLLSYFFFNLSFLGGCSWHTAKFQVKRFI